MVTAANTRTREAADLCVICCKHGARSDDRHRRHVIEDKRIDNKIVKTVLDRQSGDVVSEPGAVEAKHIATIDRGQVQTLLTDRRIAA
jgi:hypothetical protein